MATKSYNYNIMFIVYVIMLKCLVQGLESSCHLGSAEEVSTVLELLQESSQWFPGGSK